MPLTRQLLEQALESCRDAVTIFELRSGETNPAIVFVNGAFEAISGRARSETLGRGLEFLEGEGAQGAFSEALDIVIASGESHEGESWCHRKDGEAFLMAWRVDALEPENDDVRYFLTSLEDVTLRRQRRRRREDLEQVVGLQRAIVAGGLDLQRVRQRAVEAARNISGADAAVVEEAEGDEMVYRAVAGKAEGSLGLRLPIDSSLTGHCFQRREILQSDDTSQDPRVHREMARKVGFISGILVPLVHERQCYGVLKVYASRPNAFSSEDRQLLEIASGILAGALFNAARFEEEVNRRSMLVDVIPLLVSYVDRDRRYREVNAAYEDWFGVRAADIRGKFMWEVLGEAAYELIRPHVDAALNGEQVSFEAEIPYRAGGKRTVLAQYQPNLGRGGHVAGMYAVVRDLTPVKQAEQDFLTGLWNRRKCEEKAGDMLRALARYGHSMSLMLLDVDHFKSINDQYGHMCGDEVLKDLGEYLSNTVRGVDVVGRWGGEEFVILAPETAAVEARLLAERICNEIRRQSFGGLDNITLSIGVTQAGKDESLEQVLKRADSALYRAKREGRDRAVVAELPEA